MRRSLVLVVLSAALAAQDPVPDRGRPKAAANTIPQTFQELTRRLRTTESSARAQLLSKFLAGRSNTDATTQRARLLLASDHLRRLAAGRAMAEFRIVRGSATATDAAARDRRARAVYGISQASELLGWTGRKVCQAALDELLKDYRDLRYARYAIAAKARMKSRAVVRINKPAPTFKPVLDLAGRLHSSATQAGQPMLLMFVAPAESAGIGRIKQLVAAWRAGGGANRAILLFAVEHDVARVRAMVKKHGFEFPVIHAGGEFLAPVVLRFGVQCLPDSFLVGPDGTLLLRSPRLPLLREAARALRSVPR